MTTDQLRDTYTGRISSFQNTTRHHTRLMNYLALLRLIMLVVLVWLIVLGVKHHQSLFYLGSGLAAAGFLFLVSRYNRQKDLRTLNTRLRELNELEISCLDHQFHSRPDGMEYADSSHPWSHDLDLFGKGSLYQFLNRTSTLKGSELLAGMLTTEPGDMETIGKLRASFEKMLYVHCTRCEYCMPCPHGVNIPFNFIMLNEAKWFGEVTPPMRNWYNSFSQIEEEALKTLNGASHLCVECGECLKKCPQKIPIPEKMKEVSEIFSIQK